MNDHTTPTADELQDELDVDIALTQDKRLISVLYALEEQIKRQNSLKYTLARGVVYGLGTVIGATVLVAIFGGLIASFISSFTGVDIVQSSEQR